MFVKSPPYKEEEASREWGTVPNYLEDIIGERCRYVKYNICFSCNEFYPQRGKVKCIRQRYSKHGYFKEHTTTDYRQVNTARKQSERKLLNDYITEHGCSPPPRKNQVPLGIFFTPTIRSDSTNNRSDAIIGPKIS